LFPLVPQPSRACMNFMTRCLRLFRHTIPRAGSQQLSSSCKKHCPRPRIPKRRTPLPGVMQGLVVEVPLRQLGFTPSPALVTVFPTSTLKVLRSLDSFSTYVKAAMRLGLPSGFLTVPHSSEASLSTPEFCWASQQDSSLAADF